MEGCLHPSTLLGGVEPRVRSGDGHKALVYEGGVRRDGRAQQVQLHHASGRRGTSRGPVPLDHRDRHRLQTQVERWPPSTPAAREASFRWPWVNESPRTRRRTATRTNTGTAALQRNAVWSLRPPATLSRGACWPCGAPTSKKKMRTERRFRPRREYIKEVGERKGAPHV